MCGSSAGRETETSLTEASCNRRPRPFPCGILHSSTGPPGSEWRNTPLFPFVDGRTGEFLKDFEARNERRDSFFFPTLFSPFKTEEGPRRATQNLRRRILSSLHGGGQENGPSPVSSDSAPPCPSLQDASTRGPEDGPYTSFLHPRWRGARRTTAARTPRLGSPGRPPSSLGTNFPKPASLPAPRTAHRSSFAVRSGSRS